MENSLLWRHRSWFIFCVIVNSKKGVEAQGWNAVMFFFIIAFSGYLSLICNSVKKLQKSFTCPKVWKKIHPLIARQWFHLTPSIYLRTTWLFIHTLFIQKKTLDVIISYLQCIKLEVFVWIKCIGLGTWAAWGRRVSSQLNGGPLKKVPLTILSHYSTVLLFCHKRVARPLQTMDNKTSITQRVFWPNKAPIN